VRYDWDQSKAESNAKKHGVRFPEAVVALEDEGSITIEDPDAVGEERFVSIGSDDSGRILVTIFAYRGDIIRIISSRKASKAERIPYENRS
jgi:hypothetical protein